MTELINSIRYYHFMAGVLINQQADPLCVNCKAFANTAAKMKEGLLELKRVHAEGLNTLQAENLFNLVMLEEASEIINRIKTREDAVGQKKAGNCMMPEGVCFIKRSKKIIEKP